MQRIERSKYILNLLTGNGIIYYKGICPELRKRDENSYYNISSPFRNDKNPSFSITRDPATNKWHHFDFGELNSRGDAFSFAAKYHKLDVVK